MGSSDDKHGLATRLIHGGGKPDGPGRPVVSPLVLATTFEFETAEQFGRVMADEEYGFLYGSLRNPTTEEVAAACAEIESAEAAQLFSSGMAGIAAALFSNLSDGDTLLAPKQLYGNTFALVERHVRRIDVEVVYLDVTDPAAWDRPARVRYVETLANPGFPLADLAAIAETKGDGVLIVDNTFASPALCRPLEHGADLVCESATKFLNGHHDVMAGVVAGSRELVEATRRHRYETGGTLDPFAAFLLRRGLKTLALRMERQSLNALAARPLPPRPRSGRGRPLRRARLLPAVRPRACASWTTPARCSRSRSRAAGRPRSASWTGSSSASAQRASAGSRPSSPTRPRRATASSTRSSSRPPGVSQGMLRVSVGCEDVDDLTADFERALARA